MIEQTSSFRGKYFVLLGHLSPLDGIGPEEIGIAKLKAQPYSVLDSQQFKKPKPASHAKQLDLWE